jgi:iron(III) transport system ATP-binding protein
VAERYALEVLRVTKVFPDRGHRHLAVDGVQFAVREGEFYTLLGPSGCGKTTTLRCVAGLERADGGEIRVAGQVVSAERVFVPPNRRDIGMVFQNYAIWPHMNVFENAAFPLRVGGRISTTELKRRVGEALELVQLGGLDNRMATQLSGGQQQRLALARALVRRPKLLLLDEPLSNLDARLRDRMRALVRDVQRRLGISALYVTHDQAEALSMSDRVAVMQSGRIVQEGSPEDVYQRPASRFVADFVGTSNFVPARVVAAGADGVHLDASFGELTAGVDEKASIGTEVTLFVRPENIRLFPRPVSGMNVFAGRVEDTVFLGEHLECGIRLGAERLVVREHPGVRLAPGDEVYVELSPASCALIVDDSASSAADITPDAEDGAVGSGDAPAPVPAPPSAVEGHDLKGAG